MTTALRWLARALGAVGVFVALYVTYAHVAGMVTMAAYDPTPIDLRFTSNADVSRLFEVRSVGGLEVSGGEGSLHVRGTSSQAGDHVDWVSRPRRLGEVRVRLRAKVNAPGAYDVSVGVESTRGATPRSLRVALVSAKDQLFYDLIGDLSPHGVALEGDHLLTRYEPSGHEADRSKWHELVLRMSPELHQALFSVDDAASGSHWAGWDAGEEVRFVFGVTAREPGQAVDVEITEAAMEPLVHDYRALDVTDRFDGKLIDPRHWIVQREEQDIAETGIEVGAGLHLTAKAVHVPKVRSVVQLISPPLSLGSLRASMNVEIKKLHKGSVLIAIANELPFPGTRGLMVGLVGSDDPEHPGYVPFAYGQWQGNGQAEFAPLGRQPDTSWKLAFEHDAKTRMAKVWVNGDKVLEKKLDLEPMEAGFFRVGTELSAPDAEFDVLVREVHFERLTEGWE